MHRQQRRCLRLQSPTAINSDYFWATPIGTIRLHLRLQTQAHLPCATTECATGLHVALMHCVTYSSFVLVCHLEQWIGMSILEIWSLFSPFGSQGEKNPIVLFSFFQFHLSPLAPPPPPLEPIRMGLSSIGNQLAEHIPRHRGRRVRAIFSSISPPPPKKNPSGLISKD